MSASVMTDLIAYLQDLGVVERNIDAYTEADLNGWPERPSLSIFTMSTPPEEPSLTADVDTHRVVIATVSGMGEQGYEQTVRMADSIYRALRPKPMGVVLDQVINGTLYKCIRCLTPPYLVSFDADQQRSQYNIDVEVTRYIGDETWA